EEPATKNLCTSFYGCGHSRRIPGEDQAARPPIRILWHSEGLVLIQFSDQNYGLTFPVRRFFADSTTASVRQNDNVKSEWDEQRPV
ncbi:MAG: hypothetical protein II953_05005, partial [Clostridia bacterium]|nr:hypothetical protein [Clostridia bacterium]